MGKLASNSPSIDTMLTNASLYGPWVQPYHSRGLAATTAATTTSGYATSTRHPNTLAIPTLTAPVTGVRFTQIEMHSDDSSKLYVAALEYVLGTFVMNTSTFTAGVTVPTKIIRGLSLTGAGILPMLAYTVAGTGTAATFTITYTNQAGTANHSMTISPPTPPIINSAFCLRPHLATGDTAMRAVTDISKTGGTNGTIIVTALLVLQTCIIAPGGASYSGLDLLPVPNIPWIGEAGDVIAFYAFGGVATSDIHAVISGVADV